MSSGQVAAFIIAAPISADVIQLSMASGEFPKLDSENGGIGIPLLCLSIIYSI